MIRFCVYKNLSCFVTNKKVCVTVVTVSSSFASFKKIDFKELNPSIWEKMQIYAIKGIAEICLLHKSSKIKAVLQSNVNTLSEKISHISDIAKKLYTEEFSETIYNALRDVNINGDIYFVNSGQMLDRIKYDRLTTTLKCYGFSYFFLNTIMPNTDLLFIINHFFEKYKDNNTEFGDSIRLALLDTTHETNRGSKEYDEILECFEDRKKNEMNLI
jgi:hypothetical protein